MSCPELEAVAILLLLILVVGYGGYAIGCLHAGSAEDDGP